MRRSHRFQSEHQKSGCPFLLGEWKMVGVLPKAVTELSGSEPEDIHEAGTFMTMPETSIV